MTDVTENKRLSDDELEAVAGGVTPPTIDPSALAGLMHSTVSAAIAGGGAYTVDTPTPAHTDGGTLLVVSQTHTIAPATKFGASSMAGPEINLSSTPVASGSVTLSGDLSQHLDLNPPGSITDQTPTIQVMHIDSTQGQWTRIDPVVQPENHAGEAPNPGGTYGIANRESVAFNSNANVPISK